MIISFDSWNYLLIPSSVPELETNSVIPFNIELSSYTSIYFELVLSGSKYGIH